MPRASSILDVNPGRGTILSQSWPPSHFRDGQCRGLGKNRVMSIGIGNPPGFEKMRGAAVPGVRDRPGTVRAVPRCGLEIELDGGRIWRSPSVRGYDGESG